MKLIKKHIFKGTITLESGLHIGGSKSSMDIGGLDSSVIKTAKGIPYIPGSSLKGKMRSLLAMKEGANYISLPKDSKLNDKQESNLLLKLFGCSDKGREQKTQLIFRDALLDVEKFKETFANSELLVTEYTEEKYENTIDRLQGKARNGGLRQMERVPAGSIFNFEIVLDEYEGDNIEENITTLKKGFELLQDDYLGGSGTRGYGKITINYTEPEAKSFSK